MSGIVVAERCQYCSRQLPPADVNKYARGVVRMCDRCRARHADALRALAGEPPLACAECGVSFAVLKELALSGNNLSVRMVLAWKDGMYQVLCAPCNAVYEPKRRDLFEGTPYGRSALNL